MRYSVEVFPPKSDDLIEIAGTFLRDGATHISLTYGANGTDRIRSHGAAAAMALSGIPTAAHITCAGSSREDVDRTLSGWIKLGIRHFVALRGDNGGAGEAFSPHPDGYTSSIELIERIRDLGGRKISVACYPNGHPDYHGGNSDIDYLKRKQDAGATTAVTQFFFNADDFIRFRDRCVSGGVSLQIVPGIMPIFNFSKVSSFARKCGEPIPHWLAERFEGLDDAPDHRRQVAVATVATQLDRLEQAGVDHVHLYSCNDVELTRSIGRLISYPMAQSKAA